MIRRKSHQKVNDKFIRKMILANNISFEGVKYDNSLQV